MRVHVHIDEHHSAKDFAFYRNEATLAFVQAGEIARFGHREQRAVPAISPAVIGAHEPLGCAGRFQHDAGTAMPADIVECTYLIARTAGRSEERRVGKEGVSTCRSRWSPYP